ncbi:MAG: endonuclease III [Bordetella sp.]|jgi:endonuclease-3
MNPVTRQLMFERLDEANRNPTTELNFSSPFELLTAVLLSAQATDVSVNAATAKLFALANTPRAILDLGEKQLIACIRTIGLYQTKARHLRQACQILLDRYDGKVPEDREALEGLPGVGRKTANVVLNTAFGWETIAVDTHIFRVSNRTGLAKGKTVLEVEKRLLKNVPLVFRRNAHHWLILHGRYVCKARRPECFRCGLSDLCDFKPKTPLSGTKHAV